jgi:hypothetical protein
MLLMLFSSASSWHSNAAWPGLSGLASRICTCSSSSSSSRAPTLRIWGPQCLQAHRAVPGPYQRCLQEIHWHTVLEKTHMLRVDSSLCIILLSNLTRAAPLAES